MSILESCISMSDLRPSSDIMRAERLGAFRLTSLSFTKVLVRKMHRQKWDIKRDIFDLDKEGYGIATYTIATDAGRFSFIVVSTKIDETERSDRVISEKWDVTFALCEGILSEEKIQKLSRELPKQEFGRGDTRDLVWSRANKSGRVFSYVVDCLAKGMQPDPTVINEVGYLFRTTAVYGNGKFGIAPYERIKEGHPFSGPYQAQMFAVYLLRHFSFDLVEHIAKQRNEHAVRLRDDIKRFIGTGNATGLGMVPFLIAHPKLLHQWIFIREQAIMRLKHIQPTKQDYDIFLSLLRKARVYFSQLVIAKPEPFLAHQVLSEECAKIEQYLTSELDVQRFLQNKQAWKRLLEEMKLFMSYEMEELMYTLLLELYEEEMVDLEGIMNVDEVYELIPDMNMADLLEIVEENYHWVQKYDFTNSDEKYYFWYRSVEKEEPRMGVCGEEIGEEKALPLNIAEQVQQLHDAIKDVPRDETVASFLLRNPVYKGIIKRVQSLKDDKYAEIQSNILDKEFLPIYLLRCKLAIFGAERFDPKSNLWVRITLFQGAPLVEELGNTAYQSWIFPALPTLEMKA